MAEEHKKHGKHPHQHGKDCGHPTVEHDGHKDYLHDGHMHHVDEDHVDEHVLAANKANPADCTPKHECDAHEDTHEHGSKCGHEAIPHGDHTDYAVDGHLHHAHGEHCDDHGKVKISKPKK